MDLTTTVVGSYPSKLEPSFLERAYHAGKDPFLKSMEQAVKAQVESGVKLVSDGQTRGDMISIFARGLRGFRIKERVEIISKICYKGPITAEDQERVKKLLPQGVKLKGIITGPWTMANSVKDLYYGSKEECMFDIADALHKEARVLSGICDFIQVDEPFLSMDYHDSVKEAVENVLDVKVKTALHVCGDVGNIARELVEYDVDILDHEFTDYPSLYGIYGDMGFSQRFAVGVVSTEPHVEKVDVIVERIQKVLDTFGPASMIDPDCGLRNLPEEVARNKLINMVKAREMVLNERG
ncbi:MAG: methionine synthase [Thermoplasmata archaeon]